jgi:hypothetical protein
MTPEQQKELWRWAVHNRAFEVSQAVSEIRSTFLALGGEGMFVHDKWTIAERQLRVCALELENLRNAISRIAFEPQTESTP